MARQVTISVIKDSTRVVIDYGKTVKEITSNGDRSYRITSLGIQFFSIEDDPGLNNEHILLTELTNSFGATTPQELADRLDEIGAFKRAGLSALTTVTKGNMPIDPIDLPVDTPVPFVFPENADLDALKLEVSGKVGFYKDEACQEIITDNVKVDGSFELRPKFNLRYEPIWFKAEDVDNRATPIIMQY